MYYKKRIIWEFRGSEVCHLGIQSMLCLFGLNEMFIFSPFQFHEDYITGFMLWCYAKLKINLDKHKMWFVVVNVCQKVLQWWLIQLWMYKNVWNRKYKQWKHAKVDKLVLVYVWKYISVNVPLGFCLKNKCLELTWIDLYFSLSP